MTAACTDIAVSAIVSTCNAERFIRGCIEDLERQTIAGRLEIIVIDSGSEQREGEIVRELQQVYGNIRYIRTERETVYAAWNRGVAMARGRYLTNANTDDRHRIDALEIMAKVLDSDPSVDLVYADVLITRTENETFERNTATGRYNWFPWDRNILLDRGCFIGPQPMWRRSLHDLYGMFDPALVTSGDYEFWLRISQTSNFHYIEEPLGLYLQHPQSIEHRHEERKFAENREILQLYRKAADQGRLVRFLPFQELNELSEADGLPEIRQRREVAVRKIDAVVAALAPSKTESVLAYRQARNALLPATESATPLVERLVVSAEKAIFGSMEWCLNRPDCHAPGEAELRATLMAQAVAQGRTLFQQGDVDGAVSVILNRGIKAAPLSLAPYVELVEVLIAAGRFDDALQVFPEMPPGSDRGVISELAAVCHAALGDDAAANLAARSALAEGGCRPRALVVLGTLAARQGRVDEAESFFRQSVQVDPACASGWLSLGMLLWGGGKLTEAFDTLCHAVDTEPANAGTVDIFLEMSRRLDRRHDATLLLKKVCDTHPDCRAVARATIIALAEQGHAMDTLTVARDFLSRFGIDDDVVQAAAAARGKVGAEDRLAAGAAESITLCMIVRNEEKHLARCLASALPLVHEMVIVDTGSDDRTVALAEAFGARIVRHAWNDDYAAARNIGLAAARGTWVLVLDADEALSALDYPLIRNAVRHGARTAWQVITRNYTEDPIGQGWEANDGAYPDEEAASGWYPSWKVRLFPRSDGIRFRGRVHEMVEPALREGGFDIRRASFVVHHYGELDREASLARKRRYYELGKEKLVEQPDDIVLLTELAVQAGELELPAEALDLWDRVLANDPENVEALFNRGGILLLLERYAHSKEDSRRAVTLRPSHREARLNLALAELHLGEVSQAHLEVERLEPLSVNYPPFWGLALVDAIVAGDAARTKTYRDLLKRHGFSIPLVIDSRTASLERAGQGGQALRLRQWLQAGC